MPILAAAWQRLDEAGIPWLILRDGPVDGSPGEVDLLVGPRLGGRIARLLAPVGFVPLPGRPGGSHRQLAAWDGPARGWWKLDLVDELAYGRRFELPTHAEEPVLRRRQRTSGGTLVPSPADDAMALGLHLLLDRRRVGAGDLAAFAVRLEAAGGAAGSPLATWLEERVAGAARSLPPALGDPVARTALRRDVRRAAVAAAPAAVGRRLIAGALARRLARLPRPGHSLGLQVAVLGPDGAGKSALVASLGAAVPVPVQAVYLGLYPVRPVDRAQRGRCSGLPIRRPRIPGLGLARRLLRLRLGWLRGALHARAGGLTVYDRHPLEARLGAPSLRRRLLARSLPRPDLVLVLDAPADVLLARKAEHPLAELQRQRVAYRALAARGDAVLVDVDAPPAEVLARVGAVVAPRLRERLGAASAASTAAAPAQTAPGGPPG